MKEEQAIRNRIKELFIKSDLFRSKRKKKDGNFYVRTVVRNGYAYAQYLALKWVLDEEQRVK